MDIATDVEECIITARTGGTVKAAILPDELVAPKPRLLSELGPGETGHITFTEMLVLPDRSCFVNLQATLRANTGVNKIQVRRAEVGSYHVTVPADTVYEPGRPKPAKLDQCAPVASIAIGPKESS